MENNQMKQLQLDIAEEAVFEDDLIFSLDEDLKVCGIDQAFTNGKAVSSAVVMQDGEVVEKASGEADLKIPYIPGLLAFREGEAIIDALDNLSAEPDLLMLDGSGRIHFRQAGIAVHIGVLFDKASIGIAKNLLCGKVNLPEKMSEESSRKVVSDGSVENIPNGKIIGYAYQSRQYDSPNSKINPLYVSSGHKVSEETAVDLVERFDGDYKLPEPTRLADREVETLKQEYSD
ncbi:MAG: endonuclease V [Candidatus Nanohaloarchaea archaeon]